MRFSVAVKLSSLSSAKKVKLQVLLKEELPLILIEPLVILP